MRPESVTSIEESTTADHYHFDHDFLSRTAIRIINWGEGYQHGTSKPPGTIKWK